MPAPRFHEACPRAGIWSPCRAIIISGRNGLRSARINLVEGETGESIGDMAVGYALVRQGGYHHREVRLAGGEGVLSWCFRRGGLHDAPAEGLADDFWLAGFGGGESHSLAYSRRLRLADARHWTAGVVYDTGGDGDQIGMRLSYGTDSWRVGAEGGVVFEDGGALGAEFEGGLRVDGSKTAYRRLSGVWCPAAGAGGDLLFYAGYVRTETEAATGGILRGLSARADELAVGGRFRNWELRHLQPLVVVSGRMDLALVDGYAASGGYRVGDLSLDLSSAGRRPRTTALLYRGESARIGNLSYLLALRHADNSPLAGYGGSGFGVSAGVLWRF